MSDYEIWIDTDTGSRQRVLFDVLSFEYVKTVNSPGYFSARLPKDFDRDLLKRDNLVEIWRRYPGGSLYLDWVGFLRRIRYTEDEVTISGPDMLDLLRRRIVDYPAGDAMAGYGGQVSDDFIKRIVRENLGASATDTARNLTSAGLSVATDTAQGATVIQSFAWRNVLTVCQGIAEASREAGTALYFDIEPTVGANLTFTFQTYITRRGSDRTGSTLVGYDIGNMASPSLDEDYTSEVNWCRAGGQGEEADRMTATSEDTERSGASVWARVEFFQDARHLRTTLALTDAADARVSAGRPRLRFEGTLVSTPSTLYGRDWGHGDTLSCVYAGRQFDADIRGVRVAVDISGNETIEAKLEADL